MWRELTRDVWRTRLKGVQRNVDVWQALLSVRQLVLPMHEDTHTHLKFASLCRKSGRVRCAQSTHVHGRLHCIYALMSRSCQEPMTFIRNAGCSCLLLSLTGPDGLCAAEECPYTRITEHSNTSAIRRQSRRVLVQLLEYDPMSLQPSEPGFGSGSGKPAIMFGFLKHLWTTAAGPRAAEQQQQALFRCPAWGACKSCWNASAPLYASATMIRDHPPYR